MRWFDDTRRAGANPSPIALIAVGCRLSDRRGSVESSVRAYPGEI